MASTEESLQNKQGDHMTSEVVIANSQGIAMAADSAVTINGQKIYNSALKLFSLSKFAPIGVMIYGGATLGGTPWETIIKVYRKLLGQKTFGTVREYADDFISHIKSYSYWDQENDFLHVGLSVETIFNALNNRLSERIRNQFEAGATVDESLTKAIFLEELKAFRDQIGGKYIKGYNKKSLPRLRRAYKDTLEEKYQNAFHELALDDNEKTELFSFVLKLLISETFNQSAISGVVIAGFGEEEIYPSVATFEFDGILDSKPRVRENPEKTKALKSTECSIFAFAQEDMVRTFLCGLNPSLEGFLFENLHTLFARIPEIIADNFLAGDETNKNNTRNYIVQEVSKLHDEAHTKLGQFMQSHHVNPILQMTSALPKDELAAMAESLINLTAFKRKMSDSLETVGGPIDVAVISKGDGLVWVKRKHYFPRELNSTYFGTYFHGYDKVGSES